MTFETGTFHEYFKYSKNFKLPIKFIIEDNNMSANSPTNNVWGKKVKYQGVLKCTSIRENIPIMALVNGYYFNEL